MLIKLELPLSYLDNCCVPDTTNQTLAVCKPFVLKTLSLPDYWLFWNGTKLSVRQLECSDFLWCVSYFLTLFGFSVLSKINRIVSKRIFCRFRRKVWREYYTLWSFDGVHFHNIYATSELWKPIRASPN